MTTIEGLDQDREVVQATGPNHASDIPLLPWGNRNSRETFIENNFKRLLAVLCG